MIKRFQRLARSFAWWLLRNVQPAHDEVDVALRAAFADCGLNKELYSEDFNLRNSGKFYDVMVQASDKLGNPLQTVADVKTLLS